ncbi:phosphomevalonate kinase [Streptococcus sanguinis SK1 = NCTC 7863]|jgi:phosphomevalonate kinase|uniref:phosphomevalonate kinase n=1 Tax=Streptococcus sanguinis SK408 TaxID=888818 RepID=F2CG49_STRSA|nr:phosphomevalonate kinase [Streptococcus sanguinis]EGF05829.1 phosphomevalonate kinase [Streptococcus sanguinis SK1 = NCTC 7863]EGF18318.1 phosphomevalonate kinase [Streptococcus sanguinis SK408]EGF22463.1 phosphomevalonate kinase [Streptococcus sanguinis SK1058]ETD07296.1 phosphomevalonate kinase [Streptococcus sanguinis CC94A]MBZ2076012.1 phosphomevalonate kinase [Streptococcus sanguinis]
MKVSARVQTCGKLYLAGEYAVLTAGQPAIIKAIPIYMTGEIQAASAYRLTSDMFEHSANLESDPDYALIQETVGAMNTYLLALDYQLQPFSLKISGKMERDGKKFGIGSSGSVVILTLKAMAALYELDLEPELLFKLASYVLLKRGDNGSMGDLACIAYEDLIYYRSFDRELIRKRMDKVDLLQLLAEDWGFEIRSIKPRLAMDFLVGWTKQPAISKDLVNQVKSAISESFLTGSRTQVDALERALLAREKLAIQSSLEKASQLLERLSPAIYTDRLKVLKEAAEGLNCVAKSSGAGGGDCGIALSFDVTSSKQLIQAWQAAGIELLYRERMGHDEPES